MTNPAESTRHPQKLYAVHLLGGPLHREGCAPDLFSTTLLPLGLKVRCSTMGCNETWTLVGTQDASSALIPASFPENRNYGCVDCGSINHTTGSLTWCDVAQARAEQTTT